MAKKVMSKSELLERRDEIIAEYSKPTRKNAKKRVLTKKERKVLGVGRDQGKATLKHLRMNAFKVNALIRQVVGKSLEEAYAILLYTPHGAAQPLTKLLKSAEANAVKTTTEQGRPVCRNVRDAGSEAFSKGQASWILKRSCHVHVVLKEKEQEV